MTTLKKLYLFSMLLMSGSITYAQGEWLTGAGNPCLNPGLGCSPAAAGGVGPTNNFFGTALGNNTSIRIGTNGIQRGIIQNGGTANNDGYVGFGNNINGFAPQSRMHLHQTAADNSIQITNDGTGVSTNDGSRVTVNSNNDPLRNGNTFIYNQENRHLLLSTNANTDAANFNNAVTNNTLERVRVTAVGTPTFTPAAGYGVFNPANLTANTTRVSISYEPTVPVTRPLSLLHIGFNAGSTAQGPPGSVDGWRPWMDIGTYTTNGADNMYFGLKNEGSTERQDAVIGWGDDDATLVTTDNLRFIFTADALSAGPEPSKQADGLEIARMEATKASTIDPNGDNFGMMGIGNFYNSGIQPIDAKLDIDGDLRIRQVNDKNQLTRVLVIDENDLNRVYYREASTLNTDNQTLSYNPATGQLDISGGNFVIIPPGGGGPGTVTADNGLTINPAGNVQLGGTFNGVGNPNGAELLNSREVPMQGHRMLFSGEGQFGVGATVGSRFSVRNDINLIDVMTLQTSNGDEIFNFSEKKKLTINADLVNGEQAVFMRNTLSNPLGGTAALYGFDVFTTTNDMINPYTGARVRMIGVSNQTITGLYAQAASPADNGTSDYIGVWGQADRGTSGENIGVFGRAGGSNDTNIGVKGRATGSPGTTRFAGYFEGNVHVIGNITATGTITGSDNMFKTNQQSLTNAMAIISQLTPKTYNLDSANFTQFSFDNRQHMGLIAQEVEQVLPNLVYNARALAVKDSTGSIITPELNYKGLNYEEFIPLLIAGMQEQQNNMDAKDSVIADLNARLQVLEQCVANTGICNPQARPANSGGSNNEGTVIQLENMNSIILDQNVPNPFAEKTTINYSIAEEVNDAQLMFYNTQGRIIKQVTISERGEGKLTIYGENLEKGIYTYSLIADGEVIATKKMVKQ